MKTIITIVIICVSALTNSALMAQEIERVIIQDSASVQIAYLEKKKENIIAYEKEQLKEAVMAIDSKLEAGKITKEKAQEMKEAAARETALNIENRIAIVDNKIALLERNPDATIEYTDADEVKVVIGRGKDGEDGDSGLFSIKINGENVNDKKPIKYDRRTYSDLVIAFGLNNAIIEGESLDDSPYKIGGSRFFELGWAWKTRVFDDSNWLRFKYGFSFMFNGLKMDDNQYFVDNGEQTDLETFQFNLDKSKLRMDHLVFPIHFEVGPSKKKEYDEYFRYSTKDQFKFGFGGYAGLNLLTIQKLKYDDADGNDRKDKFKQNYNTNNLIYGLSAYVAWGDVALYAKYDLNTIFKDNPVEQRNVSLGVRFDMD